MLQHILLKYSCMQQGDSLDLLVDPQEKWSALLSVFLVNKWSDTKNSFFLSPLSIFSGATCILCMLVAEERNRRSLPGRASWFSVKKIQLLFTWHPFPFHNQPDNIYLDSQTKLQSKTGRGKLEKHLIENIWSIGLLTPIFSHLLRIILLENVCERGVLWSLRVAAGSGTIGLGINKYGWVQIEPGDENPAS